MTKKNAFQKAIEAEYGDDTRLGMPSTDRVHQSRRLNAMAQMTGGNGFQTPSKATRVFADGTTRGETRLTPRK